MNPEKSNTRTTDLPLFAYVRQGGQETSRLAAAKMNDGKTVSRHAVDVLRQVAYKPTTSKQIDERLKDVRGWFGRAHRRMLDLETLGFITRAGKPELVCTITEKGIAYLRSLK